MDAGRMIQSWIAVGCAEGLRLAGVTSGELTERKARKIYGKWFSDAVAMGHIKPCRIGTGKTGTRYYMVTDILTYKAQGCTPPSLIYNH